MKKQRKRVLPPLCRAVKKIRKYLVLTQDKFAANAGCSPMLVSKWERGVHVPTDPHILESLRDLAAVAGLDRERKLFDAAISPFEGVVDMSRDMRILAAAEVGHNTLAVRLGSDAEWIEFFSLRAAYSFLPEVGNPVRDALLPARELVKAIINEEAADAPRTYSFYNHLALRMELLIARQVYPHKFLTKEGIVK
jgi:transcriptional regulator with XRE-family HTH domain